MNFNCEFLEENDIIPGFVPVDMQTAANEGDYVNMKRLKSLVVVLFKGIGTAGDDPVITLTEAQDAAGTGAQVLAKIAKVRHKTGTALGSVTKFTVATQTAASTYDTDGIDGAENSQLLAFEIRPEELSDGFTHLKASVADVGSNAQLGCLFYIGRGVAHPQAVPATNID